MWIIQFYIRFQQVTRRSKQKYFLFPYCLQRGCIFVLGADFLNSEVIVVLAWDGNPVGHWHVIFSRNQREKVIAILLCCISTTCFNYGLRFAWMALWPIILAVTLKFALLVLISLFQLFEKNGRFFAIWMLNKNLGDSWSTEILSKTPFIIMVLIIARFALKRQTIRG